LVFVKLFKILLYKSQIPGPGSGAPARGFKVSRLDARSILSIRTLVFFVVNLVVFFVVNLAVFFAVFLAIQFGHGLQ
jgi:hypothetical protein